MIQAQLEMQNIYTTQRNSSVNCKKTSIAKIAIYQDSSLVDMWNSSLEIHDGAIFFNGTQGDSEFKYKKLTFNFNTGMGEFLQSSDPKFQRGLRSDFDCFTTKKGAIECSNGLAQVTQALNYIKGEVVAKNNQSVIVQTTAIDCATDILASEWDFLNKIVPQMD